MQLTLATHSDIDQVFDICAQNRVENNVSRFTAKDFSEKGFLISQLTKEHLGQMVDDAKNNLLYVVKEGDEVLGYLAGYDVNEIGAEFFRKNHIPKDLRDKKIFYYKHIAKKSGAKNIGAMLVREMMEEVKRRGYFCIICHIVYEPFYNQASVNFHHSFGFEEIGLSQENDVKMGVYLKLL